VRKLIVTAALLAATTVIVQAADVTIGAVLPLSGASATIGDDQRRGIELAVDEVNASGGLLGGKLNVIIEDSGGRAPSALDAAKKLVTVDNVPAVIGEYSSGITIPVGQYLVQEKRVHLNIGSSSGLIRQLGDGSFSLIGLDNVSSGFAAQDVFDNGWKKAAVIAPNNAFGQGVVTQFEKAFTALGGESGEPDVYLYSAYGREAATINREAFELGIGAGTNPWYAVYLSMCTSDSDPRFIQGQIGMDLNNIGPDGQAYADAYQAKYGEGFRSTFNGYGYDAVKMIAAAVEKAGSAEPAAISAALVEVGADYEGATGPIVFDADGQRSKQPYEKLKIDDGIKPR
jgi:branched-chain amino acid transport system substrate-binding protein